MDKDKAEKPYAFLDGKPDPVLQAANREAAAVAAIQDMRGKIRQQIRETRQAESEDRKYKITELRETKEYLNEQRGVLEADMGVNRTLKKWKAEVQGEKEKKADPVTREVEELRKMIEEQGIPRIEATRIVRAEFDKRFSNDPEMREMLEAIIEDRLERGAL